MRRKLAVANEQVQALQQDERLVLRVVGDIGERERDDGLHLIFGQQTEGGGGVESL